MLSSRFILYKLASILIDRNKMNEVDIFPFIAQVDTTTWPFLKIRLDK